MCPAPAATASPRPTLTAIDAVAVVIGIVIGAGIYEVPSLVAANARGIRDVFVVWLLGGVLSLLGALCVAELATAYPDSGGSYHYLRLAFGDAVAFVYAWSRLTVIQTGSIALLGFVFGDYASQVLPLGPYSSSMWAAFAVLVMTAMNVRDVRFGRWLQKALTFGTVIGLLFVIAAGFFVTPQANTSTPASLTHARIGLMLVFVLLSYGGWSEVAYIAAELRNVQRTMAITLVCSLGVITSMYVAANWALVRGLGLGGMAKSNAVAADLVRTAFGSGGAALLSAAVAFAVLSSMHGTMFTGARTNYALGRDFAVLRAMGGWKERGDTPARALVIQAVVALLLIAIGTLTRQGFKSMVEFTAPVFWFFLLLTGAALIIQRRHDPRRVRPFRVPGYPLTPLLFCATSAYLFYSSLMYTGFGAVLGVAVLLAGAVVYYAGRGTQSATEANQRRVA